MNKCHFGEKSLGKIRSRPNAKKCDTVEDPDKYRRNHENVHPRICGNMCYSIHEHDGNESENCSEPKTRTHECRTLVKSRCRICKKIYRHKRQKYCKNPPKNHHGILFVTTNDFVRTETKSVLSIFCVLPTLDSHTKNEHVDTDRNEEERNEICDELRICKDNDSEKNESGTESYHREKIRKNA